MRTYNVELTGKTPLLLHHDNIEWADFMEDWKSNPDNKKDSKAGDDRSPAWRWLGACYHDPNVLGVPAANIMRSIMEGGAMVPVPGGKMGKTYKAQTQSGMMCVETLWPLYVDGATISWPDVNALGDEKKFRVHREKVHAMGFNLLVKRAKVGSSKHVRVRPEIPIGWVLRGHVNVWDDQITDEALQRIFNFAGQYKGLGDWRPGGRTPGPYGTFTARVLRVE